MFPSMPMPVKLANNQACKCTKPQRAAGALRTNTSCYKTPEGDVIVLLSMRADHVSASFLEEDDDWDSDSSSGLEEDDE